MVHRFPDPRGPAGDRPGAARALGQEPAAADAAPSFHDPNFVNQMLSQLPGVDPNDPAIQAALAKIRGDEKKDDEKK